MTQLGELRDIEPQLLDLGYRIVAVSADRPSRLRRSLDKQSLHYALYSDSALVASRAFGLAWKLDDAMVKRYKDWGLDLEEASGLQHHALPVPAVFLLDAEGTILFEYVNPRHQVRIPASILLAAAREYAPGTEEKR